MADVLIVGGGAIGLTVAYELAGQGAAVTVLEQGQFGQEASWAGAGILHPGYLERAVAPDAKLRALSFSLWKSLSQDLRESTGIDNGFRNCGGVQISSDRADTLRREMQTWSDEGVETQWLNMVDLAKVEPAIGPQFQCGFRLPELCQVRNPRHLKALYQGCLSRGVRLIAGTPVVDWDIQMGKVRSAQVLTETGRYSADCFVITAGAWTKRLLQRAQLKFEINPVRGQIVMLYMPALPIHHVIEDGPRYLVPRSDGRILIGSTEEWVGFDKRNTAEGVLSLLEFGQRLVPELKQATVERCWSGLRPRSASGLPVLDRVPEFSNLFVAAGHFRSGLQLSPATGVVMRQLLLGQPTSVPLASFGFEAQTTTS